MKNKKLCCRIFPIVLIFISAILASLIWYFDEGVHQFTFLTNKGEFFNFLGSVLFIALIPIGLFYYLVEKEKYQSNARWLALFGFLPALGVIVFVLF